MDLDFYVRVHTCKKRVTGKQLLVSLRIREKMTSHISSNLLPLKDEYPENKTRYQETESVSIMYI